MVSWRDVLLPPRGRTRSLIGRGSYGQPDVYADSGGWAVGSLVAAAPDRFGPPPPRDSGLCARQRYDG